MAEDKHSAPEIPATAVERIRFQDDEEAAHPRHTRRGRDRRTSSDSLVISRARSMSRGRTDPSIALPIQYRTASFQIEESKGKEIADLKSAKNNAAQDLQDLDWHTVTTDEACQRLTTSADAGLSEEQAKGRLADYGKNAPSPPETHRIKTVFGYFFRGFGIILLTGAILVFVSWKPLGDPPAIANLALAIVLLAVFFIQAGFNMFQDWSTSRVMSSIKGMLPEDCQVVRDGCTLRLPAIDIVPGDVVAIRAGDKLPADVRFLQVSPDAKFDRSVLTGESKPVSAAVNHTDTNYLETLNIGLQGTHCILGSCVGVVVGTGDKTVFGRIAKLTNEPKTKMTPLEREVLYFVVIISSTMLTMITIVLVVWAAWLRRSHPNWINVPTLIVDCVSVAIAFIPEGLPIALTAGLTITANLMKKNKVLCKSLKTVETLGSVSVICSDKTGTLTEGRMTVSDIVLGSHTMSVDEARETISANKGSIEKGSTDTVSTAAVSSGVSQLRAMASLCNSASFDVSGEAENVAVEKRKTFGDATDSAILRFAERVEDGGVAYFRACWRRTFELAFNSKNKFMIRCFTITRSESLGECLPKDEGKSFSERDTLLTIKGAPDVLMTRCTHYTDSAGTTHRLDEDMLASLEQLKNNYSSQGKRCLLLARKTLSAVTLADEADSTNYESQVTEQARTGLTLVGMVAIIDPLRPEIQDVVSTLRGAGIRIAMVTGDFALTALAIAREAGIVTSLAVDSATALARQPSYQQSDEALRNVYPSLPPQPRKNGGAIVISGPELLALNEYQWQSLTQYDEVVFARTTPEQKLRIVREFQAANVVAMTGDGVNDAPSLKAADVGISLGSGSDIAMEAADMILLDSFSSVVVAVQYGRVVFDNLKKVISYLLPAGTFAEFWPVMTSVLFGLPQILSSFLMIIICCFTDCAAATMLSYEKPEADVLHRPPRNAKKDRLVNWQLIAQSYGVIGVIHTLTSFSMSYWYLERNGIHFRDLWFSFGRLPPGVDADYYAAKINEASSIYFINLVVSQWFNLMATRTRKLSILQHPPLFRKESSNWYLFPAIGFSLVMAVLWLYITPLRPVVGTTGVSVEFWFLPFAFGTFILLMDEARKYMVRNYPKGLVARAAW